MRPKPLPCDYAGRGFCWQLILARRCQISCRIQAAPPADCKQSFSAPPIITIPLAPLANFARSPLLFFGSKLLSPPFFH